MVSRVPKQFKRRKKAVINALVGTIFVLAAILVVIVILIWKSVKFVRKVYVGVPIRFGGQRVRDHIINEGLGFVIPFIEDVEEVYVGRRVEKIAIEVWTRDRIRVKFDTLVSFEVIPEQAWMFLGVGLENVIATISQAMRQTAWRASSRFAHEDMIGFSRRIEDVEAGGDAEGEGRIRDPATIEATKNELIEQIEAAVRKEAEDRGLGVRIVGVSIGDVDAADEETRQALQSEERILFQERGDVRRTQKHVKQAGIVHGAFGGRRDPLKTYEVVVDQENERFAAQEGRQVDLAVTRDVIEQGRGRRGRRR